MEENPTQEDIKNSVIIIALDNLTCLCDQFLELNEIDTQQKEYYSLLRDISQSILIEMRNKLSGTSMDNPIKRPKWNQQH